MRQGARAPLLRHQARMPLAREAIRGATPTHTRTRVGSWDFQREVSGGKRRSPHTLVRPASLSRPLLRPCRGRSGAPFLPFLPRRQPVLETDPLIVMSEQMRDCARNCFVPGTVFGVTLEGARKPVRRNKKVNPCGFKKTPFKK